MYPRKHYVVRGTWAVTLGLFLAHPLAGALDLEEGRWQISAGAGWGQTHRLSLQLSPSYEEFQGGFQPITGSFPESVGEADAVDDRVYEDGFVGISRFGGVPITTEANPLTTYWGYASESQIEDGSLSFTAYGTESAALGQESRIYAAAGLGEERESGFFPLVEVSRLWSTADRRHDFGVTAGLSWFSSSGALPMQRVFEYSQEILYTRTMVRDVYDLGGIIAPLPPYAGPESPPGPVIDNLPTERVVSQETVRTEQRFFAASSGLDSGLRSQRLSLGLTWNLYSAGAARTRLAASEPGENGFTLRLAGLELAGGAVLNRVALSLIERETLYPTAGDGSPLSGQAEGFTEQVSVTRVRPGGYLSAGTRVAFDRQYRHFLTLRARYEDAGSISVRAGTGEAQVDLQSWSFITAISTCF